MAGITDPHGEAAGPGQAAPGRLELVRALVNTRDLEDGQDELGSPSALVAWLGSRGLPSAKAGASARDLGHAVALREAVRALLLANHDADGRPPAAAVEVIEAAARRCGLVVSFDPDGVARPASTAAGVDGALGQLLTIIAEAQADGTWARLKACPWDTCGHAFYDHSRNRSAVWCDMAVCGNRAKVKAFRERQAGRASATGSGDVPTAGRQRGR